MDYGARLTYIEFDRGALLAICYNYLKCSALWQISPDTIAYMQAPRSALNYRIECSYTRAPKDFIEFTHGVTRKGNRSNENRYILLSVEHISLIEKFDW